MTNREVRLERLTRREVRQALEQGHFSAAIIPTGSIEQHLEHMAMGQDIASSTYVAERAAERLYPNVLVAVPVSIGLSEHHMLFPGTLSARTGSWLAVVFDAVESLMRHGVKKVLLLNGHGGNRLALDAALLQWRLQLVRTYGTPLTDTETEGLSAYTDYVDALLKRPNTGVDLRYHSYWDLVPKEFAHKVLDLEQYPGHAQEFETAFALYAFPESVRSEAIPANEDPSAASATAEKGRLLAEKAVEGVAALVEEMLAG